MGTSKTRKKAARRGGQGGAERVARVPETAESRLPRGIKLRTVSRLTMLFAAICLLAFMAGRPPGPAPSSAATADRRAAVTVSGRTIATSRSGQQLEGYRSLSSEASEIQPGRPFYVGLRVGNYELGLVERN